MIDPRDIQDLATQHSLQPKIVEKDYVLGWLLAGIAQDAALSQTWVFKGGTCLKKIYFETFRFSEDLDFTVTDARHIEEEFLLDRFRSIAAWIYDVSGIEIPAEQTRFERYERPRGGIQVEGRVYYRAALRPPHDWPKIKLDLTADERLVDAAERHRVSHAYADDPDTGIHALCYSYPEVFAEKIRALQERGRPRDLYDVVHLFRHADARAPADDVRRILAAKCEYKAIAQPTLGSVTPHEVSLRAQWESMLGHQLQKLPPFESFWEELPSFFAWLHERISPPVAAPRPFAAGERAISVAGGGFAVRGIHGAALETIRFAAANRLCVELDYTNEQGRRSSRLIEPESLRETAAGEIVLHAERADRTGHRAYRVDRIHGATVTGRPFRPQHAIELTLPGHYQPIPRVAETATSRARPHRPKTRAHRASRAGSSGLKYVYECPLCHKRFTRTKQDSSLGEHKHPSGYKCLGRTGLFRGTRF